MDWQDAERSFEHEFLRTETLARMFERSASDHAEEVAQRYKGGLYDRSLVPTVLPAAPDDEFAELTYGEMREVVRNLAAGLRDLGLTHGDRVGIFADTRMEWAQTDFAVLSAGGVVTTVYAESSPDQVQYLLGDPGATGVVVENADLADRMFAAEDALNLSFVVVIDDPGEYGDREAVYTLAEVHDRGADRFDPGEYDAWLSESDPDDLATLVYTSGTTGRPKGVKLTHRNVRSNVNQIFRRYGPRPDKDPDVPSLESNDRLLSYLPLAHIFERTAGHFLPFGVGASIAYAESPDSLREDMQLVRPTAMFNVPRIFERIYDGMREQASESALKKRIFEWSMEVARQYHRSDRQGTVLRLRHWVADRLVYSSLKEGLGGEIEMLVSGGGTLSKDLAELYMGMGLPIFEGYGLTETAPVVTVNRPENPKPGTIGPPLMGLDIDVDMNVVPEGELTNTLGRIGELLVRGPNVTEGYWNEPEETEAAFTDEGYFRTGDIVTIRPDDHHVFHERNKQMLVLTTGKNVAPQPLEEQFASREVIDQVMVLGNDRRFVTALVVPDVDGLRRWADRAGVDLPNDRAAILEDDRVRERIQAVVDEINQRFEDHERIGDFRLVDEQFDQDNDMMTPTMKKKRRSIREAYADEIESMYGADDGTESRAPTTPDDD
ncbi:MAG: long-chain fatty acid--CoA ligase [Halobacteriales archaeon]